MLYGSIILATALLLSVTAEYYSIMGLTAIFSAAVVPVIIMGASLGLGKVVATVWLHNNWKRVPWTFKSYLIPAIAFLMFLTSMGIFGFLSKAHLEQTTLTGDSQAQVALFDEKIKTQRDNIESARMALKQMDATVDQTIARSTDAGSVQIASALRKRQAKERADLQNEIGKAQAEIAKLQEQRAPLAMQSRKIEAEVGPIKYIAALLYGDNPDANLLERAVRWVIILIVLVFDPLALCLILAANLQFEWARHGRGGFVHDEPETKDELEVLPVVPDDKIPPMPTVVAPAIVPPTPYNPYPTHGPVNWTTTTITTPVEPEPIPGEEEDDAVEEVFEMPSEWDSKRHAFSEEPPAPPVIEEALLDEPELTKPEVAQAALEAVFKDRPTYFKPEQVSEDMYEEVLPEIETTPAELIVNDLNDFVDSEHIELPDEVPQIEDPEENIPTMAAPLYEASFKSIPDILNITDDEPVKPKMVEVATAFIDPNTRIKSYRHDWEPAPLVADNEPAPIDVKADFGTAFPGNAKKGDMYLRVDYLPAKLFKYNGIKWMEVDKRATDSYAFNEEYIKYLIEKIDSGEYSLDDLSETEQDQIAEYLNKNE